MKTIEIKENKQKAKISSFLAFGFLLIISFGFWLFTYNSVSAEGESDKGITDAVYVFHLFYDNGQLLTNRDFEFKYDILIEKFEPEEDRVGSFKAEILNFENKAVSNFQFDPQRGDSNFKKGDIEVKGPYFAEAAKVNFYNQNNNLLLTLSVAESSFCNNNKICNSDVGEDSKTCPSDCAAPTSSPTPSPMTLPSFNSYDVFISPGFIGLVAALAGVLIWIFLKRRKNTLPPNAPPTTPTQSV